MTATSSLKMNNWTRTTSKRGKRQRRTNNPVPVCNPRIFWQPSSPTTKSMHRMMASMQRLATKMVAAICHKTRWKTMRSQALMWKSWPHSSKASRVIYLRRHKYAPSTIMCKSFSLDKFDVTQVFVNYQLCWGKKKHTDIYATMLWVFADNLQLHDNVRNVVVNFVLSYGRRLIDDWW